MNIISVLDKIKSKVNNLSSLDLLSTDGASPILLKNILVTTKADNAMATLVDHGSLILETNCALEDLRSCFLILFFIET